MSILIQSFCREASCKCHPIMHGLLKNNSMFLCCPLVLSRLVLSSFVSSCVALVACGVVSLCVVCCLSVVLSVVSWLLASVSSLVFPCTCVCRLSRLSVLCWFLGLCFVFAHFLVSIVGFVSFFVFFVPFFLFLCHVASVFLCLSLCLVVCLLTRVSGSCSVVPGFRVSWSRCSAVCRLSLCVFCVYFVL